MRKKSLSFKVQTVTGEEERNSLTFKLQAVTDEVERKILSFKVKTITGERTYLSIVFFLEMFVQRF